MLLRKQRTSRGERILDCQYIVSPHKGCYGDQVWMGEARVILAVHARMYQCRELSH